MRLMKRLRPCTSLPNSCGNDRVTWRRRMAIYPTDDEHRPSVIAWWLLRFDACAATLKCGAVPPASGEEESSSPHACRWRQGGGRGVDRQSQGRVRTNASSREAFIEEMRRKLLLAGAGAGGGSASSGFSPSVHFHVG